SPSAAQTRWSIRAAPFVALEAEAPGRPAFIVDLLRQRGRPDGGSWHLEWDRDRGCFHGTALSGAVVSAPHQRPMASDAQRRAGPGDVPVAFVERQRGTMRVVALDAQALRLGLAAGLTLADARARVPELIAVEQDCHADRLWLERIADGCDRWTPMVELDPPDGVTLDITGCAH